MAIDAGIYSQLDTQTPMRLSQVVSQNLDPLVNTEKVMRLQGMMGQQQLQAYALADAARRQKYLADMAAGAASDQNPQPDTSGQPYGGGYSPAVSNAFGVPQGQATAPTTPQQIPQSSRDAQIQRLLKMADMQDRAGMADTAAKTRETVLQLMPKYSSTQVVKDDSGKLVNLVTMSDGSTHVLPYGVKPDMKTLDLKNRTVAYDANAASPGQTWTPGISPEAAQTNVRDWFKINNDPAMQAFMSFKKENPNATAGEMQRFLMMSKSARSPLGIATQEYLRENPDASSADLTKFIANAAGQKSGVVNWVGNGQGAKNVESLNKLGEHYGYVDQLINASSNSDSGAPLANQVKNYLGYQMGGQPVTALNVAKTILSQETQKFVGGSSQSAQAERANVQHLIDSAGNKEQMRAASEAFKHMIGGQIDAVNQHYITDTGDTTGLVGSGRLLPPAQKLYADFGDKGSSNVSAPMTVRNQQALQWANSNPNDPRSAEIKQRLGM